MRSGCCTLLYHNKSARKVENTSECLFEEKKNIEYHHISSPGVCFTKINQLRSPGGLCQSTPQGLSARFSVHTVGPIFGRWCFSPARVVHALVDDVPRHRRVLQSNMAMLKSHIFRVFFSRRMIYKSYRKLDKIKRIFCCHPYHTQRDSSTNFCAITWICVLIWIIFRAHEENDVEATQERFRHDSLQILRQCQAPWIPNEQITSRWSCNLVTSPKREAHLLYSHGHLLA